MAQKTFRETLIMELAEAGSPTTARTVPPPAPVTTHHRMVYISGHSTNDPSMCMGGDILIGHYKDLHKPPPAVCLCVSSPVLLLNGCIDREVVTHKGVHDLNLGVMPFRVEVMEDNVTNMYSGSLRNH
ncbi:unnamed protein product [Pleuronectes platessa]|uniref:Uncharacterized protein n=1 Tax=Pleuronectes platessa TaxID=8262 RepID=A0A9N7TRL1_PLEPL|nr:unnamed protein product [Pleuronectes platessa]